MQIEQDLKKRSSFKVVLSLELSHLFAAFYCIHCAVLMPVLLNLFQHN